MSQEEMTKTYVRRRPPSPVKKAFKDICGRRDALIKALTHEVKDFIRCLYDYERKKKFYLYGSPDGNWTVTERPSESVFDPLEGLDLFSIERQDWIGGVATESDSWLRFMAYHLATSLPLSDAHREKLLEQVNGLQPIFQIVENYKAAKEKEDDDSEGAKPDKLCGLCMNSWKEEEKERLERVKKMEKKKIKGRKDMQKTSRKIWIRCDKCAVEFHASCLGIFPPNDTRVVTFECIFCGYGEFSLTCLGDEDE